MKWMRRKAKREERLRVQLVRESDDTLMSFLASGPATPVWRGMDECMWRLIQRWQDEAVGSLEDKGLAIERSQALMELREEMTVWFHKARERATAAAEAAQKGG